MATPEIGQHIIQQARLERDDVDALREGIRVLAQAVMETEVSSQIGAALCDRPPQQLSHAPMGPAGSG